MRKAYLVIGKISPYGYDEEDGEILGIFSTIRLAEERKRKETYYKTEDIEIKEYTMNYFNK